MNGRSYTLDLGGAPWGEDCAQLGHTPDFDNVNRAEVAIYRAALIAIHGVPPTGIELRSRTNRHDFGAYRTLEAVIDPDQDDGTQGSYIDRLEQGVERWFHADFSPPQPGTLETATATACFCTNAIRGAISSTRPLPNGTFFPAEFEHLNINLRTAYPEIAANAIT